MLLLLLSVIFLLLLLTASLVGLSFSTVINDRVLGLLFFWSAVGHSCFPDIVVGVVNVFFFCLERCWSLLFS
jgi:hypothetical protein